MKNAFAPLSFGEKLGYGLGDTASNLYLQFWGLFLLYYFTDVYGLAPAAVATMLLVTRVLDAVSDPLMGLIADRTTSRWGRYRGYLLWVAVPYGILGYLTFAGPDLSPTGKLVYGYVTYSLVMLAYTAINVPYSALMGVISPSAEERTKVTTFRFFCAASASLIISASVTPLKNWLGGDDEVLGFRLTIALFSVLSVILFWITFATTKERIERIPRTSSMRQDLAELASNKSWWVLVVGGVLILCGLVTRMASMVFYMKYLGGDDGDRIFLTFDATALVLTIGSAGQIVGVMGTQWLAARYEKHRLMIGLALLFAGACLAFYVVPADNVVLVTALHTFTLMCFGPMIALLFAMYTDCAEYNEWRTGHQTTGLVVSASMFSLKLGSAVGAAVPGFILGWFGFVANQVQTGQAELGIRLVVTLLPAAFMALGALPFLGYRLDRTAMATVERELAERRGDDPAAAGAVAG